MHGPIILDVEGPELSAEDREILAHPMVGGVILFARNYQNPSQIKLLCQSIRAAKKSLLITVDQEGGRVQRFKEGMTLLPPLGDHGKLFEKSPEKALQSAELHGLTMAREMFELGLDLSFAPVLDLNKNHNAVVGDRSFHEDPAIVIQLAKAFIAGMKKVGMAATAKHFPGHGDVTVDSHLAMPEDPRDFKTISQNDLLPFSNLISEIDIIMPAHILFSAVDDQPVSFSSKWLKEILRKQLQFSGLIISDDLNMQGAAIMGDHLRRAEAALDAGCDMVLICNHREGVISTLDGLSPKWQSDSLKKFKIGRIHDR